MGGHIRGTVTQWQPPQKLAYTWNVFDPGQTDFGLPDPTSRSRWTAGKLTLTHLPVLERS